MNLAAFPRTRLCQAPTPLEPLPRFTDALGGPQNWMKRDDLTGMGLGGNKVRKLEFVRVCGVLRLSGATRSGALPRSADAVGSLRRGHADREPLLR